MAGDGEAVSLVADLLNEVQGRRIRRQRELVGGIVQIEGFETGLAGHALGHAEKDKVRHGQLLEHFLRHGHLTLAAVHEKDVGQLALPVLELAEATGKRLVHGCVIIPAVTPSML